MEAWPVFSVCTTDAPQVWTTDVFATLIYGQRMRLAESVWTLDAFTIA